MPRPPRDQMVVAVMGPTASGKTELGVMLAGALDGELINADSRQAISELRVATNKPTAKVLQGVPCHGMDWRHLGQPFSVAQFVAAATAEIQAVLARGRVPILVGGSGLYLRALLEGFDFGATDPDRARVTRSLAGVDEPRADLASRLVEIEPDTGVDLNNPRRTARALELARTGSRPGSSAPGWQAVKLGCRIEPGRLRARIQRRSDVLVGEELKLETRELLDSGYPSELLSRAAIGYAEAIAWLRGEISREEAVERVALRTRRYAKAQMTWLRTEPALRWVDLDKGTAAALSACLELIAGAEERD